MIYPSSRLKSFELHEDDIIHFPSGLYGFDNEKRFGLLPLSQKMESPLEWMHSLEIPDLAFVVTDPFLYVPDYRLTLTEEEKKKILLNFNDDFKVRVIVTIPEEVTDMTANLVAPIVINTHEMIAKQFVLTRPEYTTRHHLIPQEMRHSHTLV